MFLRNRAASFGLPALAVVLSVSASAQRGGNSQVIGNQAPRPLFITGQVVMADGEPLPDQVELQRVCAGIGIISEGYADPDGNFSLQIGGQQTVVNNPASRNVNIPGVPDVSGNELAEAATRSMPESQFWSCDVRANVTGYQSTRIPLVGRRYGDQPDVGAIILRPIGGVDGATISATTGLAPDEAKKEYERALKALEEEDWDEAKDRLEEVIDLYDRHAEAWYQLGRIYERDRDLDGAEEAYLSALEADSQFVNPLLRLSAMALDRQDFEVLLSNSDRVLRMNPYDFPSAYYFNGVAHLQLQHLEEAENSAQRAIQLDPNNTNPRSHYLMGFVFAQTGRLEQAAESFRTYLELAPDSRESAQVRHVLADIDQDLSRGQN